jgi:hypothetical protein
MDAEKNQKLEWKRMENFIEGLYYPSFESKGKDWCYTIYPIVRPKYKEPIGYHFAGWSKKQNGDFTRNRIEGEAKTVGECISMCESHLMHIQSL